MKKALSLFLAAIMCMGLMAGCGKQPATSSSTPAEPVSGSSVAEPESDVKEFENKELNIAIFQGGYGADYWNTMVDKFEAAYPGVKVTMTISPKLGEIIRPQIIAGNAPDFISLNDTESTGLMQSMIKERQLMDISDVFEEIALDRDEKLKDIIVPGMLENRHFAPYGDGKIYLAPFNYGPMGFIYNKTLFEEKGWDLPETWDDFFALGAELEKEENYLVNADGTKTKRALFTYQGIYPGYLEEVLFPAIASSAGMEALESMGHYEEGSFSTPEVMRVLDMFQKIAADGLLMDGTVALNHTQSQTDMMLGKALFIVNGVWMENEMKDAPREEGFEFGMMAPPVFEEGDTRYVMTSYEQFSIPANAKNPELAKEFLKFLYTEESVKEFAKASGSVYAVKDARETVKDFLTPAVYNFFEVMDNTESMIPGWDALPKGCKVNVYTEVFDNCVTPVMNGTMTTAEWAANVEEAFAEIRADLANAEAE